MMAGIVKVNVGENMSLADAISIIQTVLAVGAFIFAYQEFKQWRVETLGNKKIDLALRLGKAAIEVQEAFRVARSPFGYGRKEDEYKPNSTREEKRRQDREYDFSRRMQPLQEKMQQLQETLWEVSVLFKESDKIEKQMVVYYDKYVELRGAIWAMLDDEGTAKDRETLYRISDDDEFSKAIDVATNELLTLARSYTQ